MFLYGLLELIKEEKSERYDEISEQISKVIASYLYPKYQNAFDKINFNTYNLDVIDDYYKMMSGCADGEEGRCYCESNDGLFLLIKLALNEIF